MPILATRRDAEDHWGEDESLQDFYAGPGAEWFEEGPAERYIASKRAGRSLVTAGGDQRASRLMRGRIEANRVFEDSWAELKPVAMMESVTARLASQPAYQRILGLGLEAVTPLVERIDELPSVTMMALIVILGEDHGKPATSVSSAVHNWKVWAKEAGYS